MARLWLGVMTFTVLALSHASSARGVSHETEAYADAIALGISEFEVHNLSHTSRTFASTSTLARMMRPSRMHA